MSPPSQDESVEFWDQEQHGCGATAICNPRKWQHRFIVLIFICFLSFGSYFCYDNPAALQKEILKDMKVGKEEYMQLYSWYSWPNVVLCFFGGYLIDAVFGIRLGTVIFSLFVCAGQVVFALGAYIDHYWLMEVGRFIFGIGGESLAVAQNAYAVSWFKGKELNMVFGLQLSFSRVGSTVNMNVMGPLYKTIKTMINPDVSQTYKVLGISLFIAGAFCILSLISGIVMGFFDKRAKRILKTGTAKAGDVVRLWDIKDFPASVWLIYIICVTYYVAVFPFISLGLVFFQSKYDYTSSEAGVLNSLVYLISAGASPLLGFMVDKTGKNIFWLLLAVLMTLGAHALLAFTFYSPYIAMSIMGIAYSLLACALWPLVALIVPENQLGTAYGFMQSIQNLGLAVVAIVAGKIVDQKGYLILEVFFCGCLCVAFLSTSLLYLWDISKGGYLNMEAWKRKEISPALLKDIGETKPLIDDTYYKSPPPGTSRSPIRPASAQELRYRFYSRVAGANIQIPQNVHLSAFAFPRLLR